MAKAYYGIDAPVIIRNLLLAGIGTFLISYVAYNALSFIHVGIATFVWWTGMIAGSLYTVTPAFMLWSSLIGKKRLLKKIVAQLHLQGNEQVLDVGCGRGMFLIEIAKKLTTGKAVGIDIWQTEDQSGNALQATLDNATQEGVAHCVQVITADMRDMPFASNTFDIIVSCLAIHNVPTTANRAQALHEITRVLKVGGHLVIVDFERIDEYMKVLGDTYHDLECSGYTLSVFPPMRIVSGTKK